MGEVISKKAGRERILDDVRATLTGASAHAAETNGSVWGAAATRLAPIVQLWDATAGKLAAARAELAPLEARVAVANDKGDDELRAIADEVWNLLGRPANDPVYELLFPGGAGFYADGPDDEQPAMMVLLAELLESGVAAKLGADAAAKAGRIRAAAEALATANDAARKPAARVKLHERMLTAIARVAHVELAKLKRYLKSEGLSEADIHAVIPDRPRSYGVSAGAPPAGPTPEPVPDPG